jgi:hypothetical protein
MQSNVALREKGKEVKAMDTIIAIIENAIKEKDRLIDFLRDENRSLTARLRAAEARVAELEGDYLGTTENEGEEF